MNYLLTSYATNSNIVKAASEIATLRKVTNETSVQFADVLRTKVVQCENVYLVESTKGIFIDGLPANIQSAVRMFWSREQNAHLLEIT